LNICHVITRLIIGGAQENTLLTCRGLAQRGHRVTLMAGPETGPEGSLWDEAQTGGFESMIVPNLRRAVRPFSDARTYRALARLFGQIQPDVVHTHSSKAGIVARAAAKAAGVPVIVHTIHGMSFNRTQIAPIRVLYRWLEKRTARITSAFVAVAEAMIEQSVAVGVASRERFVTIHSGMETRAFAPSAQARAAARASWKIQEGEIVVGTVARLFANKGFEQIIAAMPAALAAQPRLRFVWVGHGASRKRYERRLIRMGLRERVHFAGLVPPGEISHCLNGLDILVHASLWEGLPRAVVQALLTEVPAVSFDNDGAPEVVVHGETGLLVPFGDTSGLTAAILRLAADGELRQKLGRQGRQRCLQAFDWRDMVARLEALYVRLAHGAPGSLKSHVLGVRE